MYLYFFFLFINFFPMLWHISKEIMTVRITANVFPVFACFRLPMQNWWDTPDKFSSLLPVKVILFLQFCIHRNFNSKPHRFETETSANLSKNDCSQSKLDFGDLCMRWSWQYCAGHCNYLQSVFHSRRIQCNLWAITDLFILFLFHSVTER